MVNVYVLQVLEGPLFHHQFKIYPFHIQVGVYTQMCG